MFCFLEVVLEIPVTVGERESQSGGEEKCGFFVGKSCWIGLSMLIILVKRQIHLEVSIRLLKLIVEGIFGPNTVWNLSCLKEK